MANEYLKYYIEAIWKGKGATAEARRDIEGVGQAGEKGAKGTLSFKSAIGSLATAGALSIVAKQAYDFGAASVAAFSDAEESYGKFNVVFGDFARSTESDLDAIAEATGRSKFELIDYASTIQDTFVPLGFAREEAAKMSTSITQLAIDLASFNNLETADVVRDLQSALVGNTETLRKYGIVAQETQIKQEAITLGLWDGKGAMDAQTKASAILSLAYKGTTDAQGDAVRTADSLANKQRALEAATLDLKVAFGEGLAPSLAEVTGEATETVRWFADGIKQSNLLESALAAGLVTNSEYSLGMLKLGVGLKLADEQVTELTKRVREQENGFTDAEATIISYYKGMVAVTDATSDYTAATTYEIDAQKRSHQSTIALIVSKKQEEEATLAAAAAIEAQSNAYSIMSGAISSASTPIQEYYDAQAAIIENQGEWVGAFTDNSTQIGEISQQLAADLSGEQAKAWQEILATSAEGGAEWQAAYNALQGDLTQSQRNELIARQNDLQAASGQAISVYTGDSAAYEAAQEAKIAANNAVIMSLKETALATIEGQVTAAVAAGEISAAAGTAYLAGVGEGLGLLSEDEAEAQILVGNAALEMAEELTNSLAYVKEHGEETAQTVGETSGKVAASIAETWTETDEQVRIATTKAFELDDKLKTMADNPYMIEVVTTYSSSGSPPSGGGGTAPPPGDYGQYAAGGVVPGPVGQPQFAIVHGGEEVLTPAQRGRGGDVVQNFYSNTREAQALAWAQAERYRRERMDSV